MIYNINGNFEAGDLGWPAKEVYAGAPAWEIISDPVNAHSGNWVGVRRGVNGVNSAMRTPLIACRPGDTLMVSAYIKRVGTVGAGYVRVSLRDQFNAEVTIIAGNQVTSSSYMRSAVRTVIPDGIRLFKIDLVGTNQAGTDVYYDDVVLEMLNETDSTVLLAGEPALGDPWELGRSRVATQYTNSPKFLAWLEALLKPGANIRTALLTTGLQADIDTARGHSLDVIGEIVGVSRIIPEAIALEFFGFEGLGASAPFGEEGLLGFGARFRDESESGFDSSVLGDPEYRTLIKAKILKNHTKSTPEDIINGLVFLFGAEGMIVEDHGGMEISIVAGRQLTTVEIALLDKLDILPRPAAVKINRRTMFVPDKYFGFEGQPKAQSFGEESDPSIGGLFAEEF